MKVVIINILIAIGVFLFNLFYFINKDAGNFAIVIYVVIFFIIQLMFNLFWSSLGAYSYSKSKLFSTLFLLLALEILLIAVWENDLRYLIPE